MAFTGSFGGDYARDSGARANAESKSNGKSGDSKSSSSKSSASKSTSTASSPNSTMSEADQRNAYGAGRAAAQAIASGTAKSSGSGNLTSGNSKLTDRVASINKTLSSYGVNGYGTLTTGTTRWSSDKNTGMTEAEQRAAYGYGQDNAQKLGYVENLRNVVRNGTATPEEKAMHDQIAGKLTGRVGTNILTGGILGRMFKNAVNTGVDAVKDTYADQLASGITSGELRMSESYNDKLGQGKMLDNVLSTGMSTLAPVVGGVIGEALTQPNQTAISKMQKDAGINTGTTATKESNGNNNGFTPPSRLTSSTSDLTNTTPDLSFNYDPTRYGVTSGTRGA